MWSAENWKDYELLDTSDGERLERWGNLILIRPDPQIIWHGEAKHPAWKRADGIYRRSSSGGGAWVKNDLPESWQIGYGDLRFLLRPMGFKHTGLFPEQAANWDWFGGLIRQANRPVRVLNLFAYTGGATLAAAAAGASVVHVDAAKGIVAQARENAQLSGLTNAPIRWIVDDCKKFVEREIRRGNHYDGIIMDPPSYGRGPGGEVWKLEDSVDGLISLAAQLLSDNPLFFLVNSYTTGLSPLTMQYLLDLRVRKKYGGTLECGELGLRVRESGGFLQVSGLTYTVDTAKAYDALEAYGDHWFTAGSVSRVSISDVNGQPFDETATYAVVTSNANFNGMDSSYVFKTAAEENELSAVTVAVVRDVVWSYIASELNNQIGDAYAAPQGRLTVQ